MEIFYFISLGLFFGYIIMCWHGVGLRPTMSHWFYDLHMDYRWVTPAYYCNIAWPLASVSGFDTFVSLSCGMLVLTSFLPFFKNDKGKLQSILHTVFATSSALFINISFIILGYWYITAITSIVAGMLFLIKPKNYGTWIEMVGFIGAFLGIYLIFVR